MTDQDLLGEVQLALLEPVVDKGQTWASEVWTRQEVVDGLNSAIWALLSATHAQLAYTLIAQPAASNGLVTLPGDWMATALVVWRDGVTAKRTVLGPVGRFDADLAIPTWQDTAAAQPIGYNEQEADTLTMQLVPKNLTDGTLELLYVNRPAALLGEGATLPVVEELAIGVKWRLIGFLLQTVGRLVDADRSAYCTRRYDLAVEVTKILLTGWA